MSTTKKILVTVAALIAFYFLWPPSVQRYQIYASPQGGRPFLIDTQTGRVWSYRDNDAGERWFSRMIVE